MNQQLVLEQIVRDFYQALPEEGKNFLVNQLIKYYIIIDYTTRHLSYNTIIADEDSLKILKQFQKDNVIDPRIPERPNFRQLIFHIGLREEFLKWTLNPSEKTLNTFNYMFDVVKKGIYVHIENSIIKVYLPFSNVNYKNSFGNLLVPPPGYKKGQILKNLLKDTKNSAHRKNLEDTIRSLWNMSPIAAFDLENNYLVLTRKDLTIEPDPYKWYSNDHIFRNTIHTGDSSLNGLFDEGDKSVANFLELLSEVCMNYTISDASFFINSRDYPVLKKDGTMPYDSIYNSSRNEKIIDSKNIGPIFSQSITNKFSDFLIPDEDDIINCLKFISTDDKRPFNNNGLTTNFNEKIDKAVFRGSATGAGITLESNKRIQIAYYSKLYPDFIDAGLTGLNRRLKKDPTLSYCDFIDENLTVKTKRYDGKMGISMEIKSLLSSKLSDIEMSKYKYIIDIEGHTAAFRLGRTFSYGSVILKVDSPWKLWYSDRIKGITLEELQRTNLDNLEHQYIIISVIQGIIDIRILMDTLIFLEQNPLIGEKLSRNALKFYMQVFNKDTLLKYTYDVIMRS